jgi:2-keto-3-deoxy-L-rhamnonate aldolase RhmA
MSLRQRLLNGGKSYGPMLMTDSSAVAEILALIPGYSHIIVDHEHSPTDLRSGQHMLQAIQAANSVSDTKTEAIVRVPGPSDAVYMKKVLDSLTIGGNIGGGVLIPMVNDAATAEAMVKACHYPLQQQLDSNKCIDGTRGFASFVVRGSAFGSNEQYMRDCRDNLLIMVQVETPEAVQAIPRIAATGVDAIFIGPFDLSTSIGKSGQFDDPQVQDLIASAEEKILASGCILAGFRSPGRSLQEMFDTTGYNLICGGVDIGLLQQAARADAQAAMDVIGYPKYE